MLILPHPIHAQIAAHGAASYPYEGCGLLLGSAEDGRNIVVAAVPLPNVWPVESEKPERFRIAEDDWRDVELEAMSNGLDVIGIFHSHPDHPAVASPRDLAWASWPGYSYLITQIIGGEPADGRSWQLMPDRSGFVEEPVEVVEDNQ
ncbi:MAG TPA: M67 family metallopeptidase [Promineifilum sp.]|nr:M67 family metallopeptidase [Promineifilum sp.]HRO91161.1 M67 family metallopeptidase [Promineifilum sp.]HRQ12977.1 M67 family metallopeptidase [Promineifilum sp.]